MASAREPELELQRRLRALTDQGVELVDPRQTYIGPEVELARVHPGARLHPGTRLLGRGCFVGEGAVVGSEGPAQLRDTALAAGCEVASGYLEGAVLLQGARVGANAHLRPGTLLEEQASTAHAVGLKHTILLPFVTLGSLINFCDCLMAGGSSRRDHSEVGSGYIHFNFTPWGERGDKATPSLIGDVVDGVFLRQRRIFLGGSGGLVGPAQVGYGAVAGAGQVLRRDVDADKLVLRAPARSIDRSLDPGFMDQLQPRLCQNIAYIAQLVALREWTRAVRLGRLGLEDPRRPPVEAALAVIALAIREREKQLERFVCERSEAERESPRAPGVGTLPSCPWTLGPEVADHLDWVAGLEEAERVRGRAWLAGVVESCVVAMSAAG